MRAQYSELENENLVQLVDGSLKKSLWIQARDSMKTFMLNEFFPKLSYAIQLDEISKNIQNEYNDTRVLTLADLSTVYLQLDKLSSIQEDGFRFMPRLLDFFINTPGRILLQKDINAKLYNLVNNWIGCLFYCKYGNCYANCNCLDEWFNRAMGRIAKPNYSFEKLVSEESPGISMRNKLFGTMINRALTMLSEIDRNIPSYEQMYNTDATSILNVLVCNRVGFQISHRDGFVFVNIDGQKDKLGVGMIRDAQFPPVKTKQTKKNPLIF